MSDSVESLLAYCRENERVCPQPYLWHQLWEMLPNRKRDGAHWRPGPPLILGAWHYAPWVHKKFRLAEHVEWAAQQGALESVSRFLRGLHEEDWFHVGE